MTMRGDRAAMLVMACLLLSISRAEARLIPIAITGEITRVWDESALLEHRINVGDPVTGVYVYESTTPDSWEHAANPYQGEYRHDAPPAGITVAVGGFVFMTDPEAVDFLIRIHNDWGPHAVYDEYWVESNSNLPLSNGSGVRRIRLLAASRNLGLLDSDALPLTAPDIEAWGGMDLNIYGVPGTKQFRIRADITSATVIPEPGTVTLLALGCFVLRRYRKLGKATQIMS